MQKQNFKKFLKVLLFYICTIFMVLLKEI